MRRLSWNARTRSTLAVTLLGTGLAAPGGAAQAAQPALPTGSETPTAAPTTPAPASPAPAAPAPTTTPAGPTAPAATGPGTPPAVPPPAAAPPAAPAPAAAAAGATATGAAVAADAELPSAGEPAAEEDEAPKPGMVEGRPEPAANSLRGGVGLFNTSLATAGGPQTFRFGMHADFFKRGTAFYTSPEGDDEHTRFRGTVNLGYSPIKYLELFLALSSQANRNLRPQTDRQDAETTFALGDTDFGVKGVYPIKDGGIGIGAQATFGVLTGPSSIGADKYNFAIDGLFTADLRHLTKNHAPVRLTANFGYQIDNSINLVDWAEFDDSTSREVARFAMGANHNRVRMRYAVDFPVRFGARKQFGIDPIVEWNWDVSTHEDQRFIVPNTEDSPLPRSSQWVTLGLRANVVSGLFLDAGADIGLVSPNFEFGPFVPPWQLIFGLGWSFDSKPVIREVPVEVPAPVVEAPVLDGRIVGQVLDPNGAPVPGALVTFPGVAQNAIVTDANGYFTSWRFPEGVVNVQVTLHDTVVAEGAAQVAPGSETNLPLQLTAPAIPPSGVVQGVFTDPTGKPIKASVMVQGEHVNEAFQSDELGRIALELPGGTYTTVISAEGFRKRESSLVVPEGGEVRLDAQLDPDKPPATPLIRVRGSRIYTRKAIRFSGGELRSSSTTALEQLATYLRYHPEVGKLEIHVHTDDRGAPQKRTDDRAAMVKAFLVARGVDASRLDAVGHGARNPVAVNLTSAGRSKNNRVEFKIAR